ncbi:hypothetical protein C2G38_2212671 [Gigaspora rosea]|uniref:Uncharacterized protein n=1 Tax=Gigaspora rosea TaxID=44941 RepID=A0A397UKX9_9GLOM|nr:hypothetical protein C2G38_2212671 [Gigaspora rosea]
MWKFCMENLLSMISTASKKICIDNLRTTIVEDTPRKLCKFFIFDLLTAFNEFGLGELVKVMQQMSFNDKASWLHLNFTRVFKISLMDNNFKPLQQFCANIIINNLQIDEGKIWEHKTTLIQKKYNKALECLTKLLEIEPDNIFFALKYHRATYFMIDRCETYRKIAKYKEALADLTSLLEIEPDNPFALRNVGGIFRKLGKYNFALENLTKTLEIDLNNLSALGEIYHMLNELEKAIIDLTKLLRIQKNILLH